VVVSPSEVAEVVGRQALVSVPRVDVRRLRIERRVSAERPALQMLFGLAATALGVCAVLYLIDPTFGVDLLP